ncbi:MAG: CDP-alcohol phosphatidyltransferase family protein [Bacteroidales bacterium]|jgi:cardiolipin synthase
MKKKEFWTIPNLITTYRLLMVPVILYFAISGQEKLFAIFLVINLVSDIIDGFIARRFKMETEIGAKLDSFADNFSYVLAFTGFYIFKIDDFGPHILSLIIFFSMLLMTVIVPLIKFRRFPSYHIYTTKIGGYIQGAFFICLFTIGFITPFYYFMIIWGILGAIECIAIDMVIPEMRSNVKGLYWVLKEKRAEKKQPE